MNPFSILGVPENCSIDDAKKAYRKLAQQHHPDKGGDATKFRSIKDAWEKIEAGYKTRSGETTYGHRAHTGGHPNAFEFNTPFDIHDIFEQMVRANRQAPNSQKFNVPEIVIHADIRKAFYGHTTKVSVVTQNGLETIDVTLPPGLPDGFGDRYRTPSGSTIIVISRIEKPSRFTLRGLQDADNLFSAGLSIGDIETEIETDAIDLITGAWVEVEDFLGEKLKVRIPAGFNPLNRLKLAGKGYYGWNSDLGQPSKVRQNMYVRVRPKFNEPSKIDREKIIHLYNLVQNNES